MTEAITLTDTTAGASETALIPAPKPGGYMGFYRSNGSMFWSRIWVPEPTGVYRDCYRIPYPLVQTRQQILDAAAACLPNGGEVKIVRIDL